MTSTGVSFIPSMVRILLAELELLSHGSTQSWNATGGGESEGGTGHPPGDQYPPHLELRKLYIQQATEQGRANVEKAMRETLAEYRGTGVDRSKVVGETREQEDARMLIEGAGFPAEIVARRFNTTPTRVRRARLAGGREVVFGRKPATNAMDSESVEDAPTRARRMKGELGMTERQIALALGESKSSVHDWVAKAS